MTLRVRFAETDAMGVAHHAAFFPWLEAARVAWLRERGFDYGALMAAGVHLAVSGVELHYRAAARFDDLLEVDCRLVELRSRRASFTYDVAHAGGGALVARGRTVHVPTGDDGRAVRLPKAWQQALRPHLAPEP